MKKSAVVFSGQGSQHPGMGKFFYENFKEAKTTFEEASDALSLDMKKLCFDGTDAELQLTINAQPCILTVSTAMWRSLNGLLTKTLFGAGHSLGEYSALVATDTIKFSETAIAVRQRGEFMQNAVAEGKGGMTVVIGTANENVEKLCNWAMDTTGLKPIEPANFNAPGQVVISGSKPALDWLKDNFDEKALGFRKPKMIPLKVSAPFHCSLMKPAEEKMAAVIRKMQISKPKFSIVQNFSAQIPENLEELTSNLIKQISSPVKWSQSVSFLAEKGVTHIIELGPGTVLAGLVKKIDSERLKTFNIQSLNDIQILEKELCVSNADE